MKSTLQYLCHSCQVLFEMSIVAKCKFCCDAKTACPTAMVLVTPLLQSVCNLWMSCLVSQFAKIFPLSCSMQKQLP